MVQGEEEGLMVLDSPTLPSQTNFLQVDTLLSNDSAMCHRRRPKSLYEPSLLDPNQSTRVSGRASVKEATGYRMLLNLFWRLLKMCLVLFTLFLLLMAYVVYDQWDVIMLMNRIHSKHPSRMTIPSTRVLSAQTTGSASTNRPKPLKSVSDKNGSKIYPSVNQGRLQRVSKPNTRGFNDTQRMNFVKGMMKHAWSGYMKFASGYDELNTMTKRGKNWYSQYSMLSTPVDALDTLWIMGLFDEYHQAKDLVLSELDFNIPEYVNVFETTIRILGGLESAYELDGDSRLLALATRLGDKLMNAFAHGGHFPINSLKLSTGAAISQQSCSLAQTGTLQLELQYLSDLTGNSTYQKKALKVIDAISSLDTVIPGIYPTTFSRNGQVSIHSVQYGIAAEADSFYEYLIKLWISTKESKYRDMYDAAARSISNNLVITSETKGPRARNVTYIPDLKIDLKNAQFSESFHHLSCFAGGMFALGAITRNTSESKAHFDLATKLTETCYEAYGHNLGISFGFEEYFPLKPPSGQVSRRYYLRPEVIESIFYMWRFTHNPIYREYGWTIAQNIEKHCKTTAGYSGLPKRDNPIQESYFLAETLKYLYLLFTDDDVIPLEQYVFNTEAHPVSVRGFGKRADPFKWVPI